jgi:zinc finger SWIM domain-containing protein 3
MDPHGFLDLGGLICSVPKVGMQFLSEEKAYSFYNKYAETIGFSVAIK